MTLKEHLNELIKASDDFDNLLRIEWNSLLLDCYSTDKEIIDKLSNCFKKLGEELESFKGNISKEI
jgi:hypothetical protein